MYRSTIDHMEFIPKAKIEKFWKISDKGEEIYFLPEEFFGNGVNQFIIYLTGMSVKKQASKTNGLIPYPFDGRNNDFGIRKNRFWTNTKKDLVERLTNKESRPGYYLVEIFEEIDDDFLIPKNWRLATINETSEILQSIFHIFGLRYLKNKLHIVEEKNNIFLAVGNFREEQGLEIWRGHKEIFRKYQKRALVIIYDQNKST